MENSLLYTNTTNNTPREKVMSYLLLRQCIGAIGILLPILLPLGTYWLDKCSPALQSSISHYYYTQMHILFVGLLCVLGAFLITYKGNYKGENIVSSIAGLCAIIVATFPDTTECYIYNTQACTFIATQPLKWYVHYLHFGSAVLLFLCFAVLCCRYFTKSDIAPNLIDDPIKKKRRNAAYITCAIGIVVSLIICGLIMKDIIKVGDKLANHYVFYCESVALFFFGFSWLLKGSLTWRTKKFLLPFIIKFFR